MQITKSLLLDYLFGGQEKHLKDKAPEALHWELKRRGLVYTLDEVVNILDVFTNEGLISNDNKFYYDKRIFRG